METLSRISAILSLARELMGTRLLGGFFFFLLPSFSFFLFALTPIAGTVVAS